MTRAYYGDGCELHASREMRGGEREVAEGNDGVQETVAEVEAELVKQVVMKEAGMAKALKSVDK